MHGTVNGRHTSQPPHAYRSSSSDHGGQTQTLSASLANAFGQTKNLVIDQFKNQRQRNSSPSRIAAPAGLNAWVSRGLTAGAATDPRDDLRSNVGFVLLCCLWYLSSALSSNTGKSIMIRFRYPVTLTFVQFAFVSGYSVLALFTRARLDEAVAVRAPSSTHYQGLGTRRNSASVHSSSRWGVKAASRTMLQGTLMMSFFQIAGHVFSSMAIARVPVSTVHTIKALSPLFTVLSYVALFGARYSSATYTALLPLTLGVMLACSFDLRANAVGFLCALGSTIVFVSQNIFSKKLLPKESTSGVPTTGSSGANKLDKLNLLFYSSGMAFVLMIPIWLYSDAGALMSLWLDEGDRPALGLIANFFLNGSVHFAQNLLAFSILARTSPVTYSIASLVKRIAVICLAIIWSGQKVSFVQAVGMAMTFSGLWMYNRAKSDVDKGERRRTVVEKRAEMSLPTSASDLRALDGVTPPPIIKHSAPIPPLPNTYAGQAIGKDFAGQATDHISPRNRVSVTAHHHHGMAPSAMLIPPSSNHAGTVTS
ncbi:hypothetical protein OIV83_003076 [Microbotryomycetes sp. JL201]|nr:hypothetical protein OIV83_003076 [Microbotryomycetes sp. JL201]